MLKLGRNLTQVVSIENYEIIFFRSDYMHIPLYLCRGSFLTTLDIYKDYFKGRQKVMQKDNTCIVWLEEKLLSFIILSVEAIASDRKSVV